MPVDGYDGLTREAMIEIAKYRDRKIRTVEHLLGYLLDPEWIVENCDVARSIQEGERLESGLREKRPGSEVTITLKLRRGLNT